MAHRRRRLSGWGAEGILTLLVLLPLAGGVVALVAGRRSPRLARVAALATMGAELTIATVVALALAPRATLGSVGAAQPLLLRERFEWVPSFGIEFQLGLDGLSLVFVLLTALLGTIAVLSSWREITERCGAYYLCLLATLSGIMGVFLAYDLFLFYFFWELMLVPMYFLIGMWGHERRIYAALKFVLFTLVSGLALLVSIVTLYYAHGAQAGNFTTSYTELLGTTLDPQLSWWLALGFIVAFAVKLPVFPLHGWLPDAHGEAPTGGSILLAGLLLKTGGYGLIRFAVPLVPRGAQELSGLLAGLAVVGVFYGAFLALTQTDLKRMIAYSSVAHMGFVMLGIAAWSLEGLQGAVMQMLAHGITTAGLFVVAGIVKDRVHSRSFADLGELWGPLPRLGVAALVFTLANIGLPGLGNFVGEFLVLLGSFRVYPGWVMAAIVGIVVGTVPGFALMQRTFYEPRKSVEPRPPVPDLDFRETLVVGVLVLLIVAIGVWPQPWIDATRSALSGVLAADSAFRPADPEIGLSGRDLVAFAAPVEIVPTLFADPAKLADPADPADPAELADLAKLAVPVEQTEPAATTSREAAR